MRVVLFCFCVCLQMYGLSAVSADIVVALPDGKYTVGLASLSTTHQISASFSFFREQQGMKFSLTDAVLDLGSVGLESTLSPSVEGFLSRFGRRRMIVAKCGWYELGVSADGLGVFFASDRFHFTLLKTPEHEKQSIFIDWPNQFSGWAMVGQTTFSSHFSKTSLQVLLDGNRALQTWTAHTMKLGNLAIGLTLGTGEYPIGGSLEWDLQAKGWKIRLYRYLGIGNPPVFGGTYRTRKHEESSFIDWEIGGVRFGLALKGNKTLDSKGTFGTMREAVLKVTLEGHTLGIGWDEVRQWSMEFQNERCRIRLEAAGLSFALKGNLAISGRTVFYEIGKRPDTQVYLKFGLGITSGRGTEPLPPT